MSFLMGSISGALAVGGVYWAFSNFISTRTAQHRSDLHIISHRLIDAPNFIPAPPPASSRIVHHRLTGLLEERWNQEVQSVFEGLRAVNIRAQDWGRKVLYGTDGSPPGQQS